MGAYAQALYDLGNEPPLLVEASGTHNLIEVINQCATMERLLDAFEWIMSQPDLHMLHVKRCHPTTSSQNELDDNDLVLVDANRKLRACFEVSDVVGTRDGNNKEQRDLVSLGVLPNAVGITRPRDPDCRLFLVVSAQFATQITNPRRRERASHRYKLVHTTALPTVTDTATTIIEVLRSRA